MTFREMKNYYSVTVESSEEHHIVLPPDAARIRFVGASGPFAIGGFSGGADGRELRILNVDTFYPLTIIDEDPKALPENRIRTLLGENVTPPSPIHQCTAAFTYFESQQRWILMEFWPRSPEGP